MSGTFYRFSCPCCTTEIEVEVNDRSSRRICVTAKFCPFDEEEEGTQRDVRQDGLPKGIYEKEKAKT